MIRCAFNHYQKRLVHYFPSWHVDEECDCGEMIVGSDSLGHLESKSVARVSLRKLNALVDRLYPKQRPSAYYVIPAADLNELLHG